MLFISFHSRGLLEFLFLSFVHDVLVGRQVLAFQVDVEAQQIDHINDDEYGDEGVG